MAHIGIFLPGDGNLKQLLISLIGDVVFGEFHLDGNRVIRHLVAVLAVLL